MAEMLSSSSGHGGPGVRIWSVVVLDSTDEITAGTRTIRLKVDEHQCV